VSASARLFAPAAMPKHRGWSRRSSDGRISEAFQPIRRPMADVGRTARTLGLTLAGLVGGLLTVSYTLQRRPNDLVMGLSPSAFGLALAGYFWLVNRDRSILKAASLTAISWAAFWLAFIIAGGEVTGHLGGNPTSSADIVAFFAGGVVGGLVVSTATFSLYANAQPRLWRLLVCTIGGGLLGVAGQQLGYLSEPHAGSNPTPALFIVWQTGMGFLIGCFWPTIEAREPTRLSIVEPSADSSRDCRRLSRSNTLVSWEYAPCFQRARRLRSRPSGVLGPVLSPP
jgi:hypothetical protein